MQYQIAKHCPKVIIIQGLEENPYLKIRDGSAKQLLAMDMVADGLW